jgi:hypothetical protein
MTPVAETSRTGPVRGGRLTRAVTATGVSVAAAVLVILSLLAGYGWLYVLRGLDWLAAGPRVGDSLPLLQLAGFDGQPLLRVIVAWLFAGLIAGVALIRVSPLRRASVAGVLGLILLLFASQAAYALARNLKLSGVLLSRRPGLGPLLEALVFAAGCALPRPVFRSQRSRRRRRPASGRFSAAGDSGLRRGQYRDAAEHDSDRDEVSADDQPARA